MWACHAAGVIACEGHRVERSTNLGLGPTPTARADPEGAIAPWQFESLNHLYVDDPTSTRLVGHRDGHLQGIGAVVVLAARERAQLLQKQ